MNGVIETLKFTNSNGEKFNLYPRTLIECISNREGDSFEETLRKYVEDNVAEVVEDVVGDTYAEKTYVAEQIAAANHLTREIVAEVPTAETAQDNVIYMYKVDSASGNDVYQEYQLINGEVVLVGDTSIDLSNYVQSEELDKILDGTTQVGDSKKLGGKDASEYAAASDKDGIADIAKLSIASSIDGSLKEYALTVPIGKTKKIITNSNTTDIPSEEYKYAIGEISSRAGDQVTIRLTSYLNNSVEITYVNGTWSEWKQTATTADLANYLPLSGGLVATSNQTPIIVQNTTEGSNSTFIKYRGQYHDMGCLGFANFNIPAWIKNDDMAWYELLHTGNKPSGTYAGNGSDVLREITVGGIGNLVYISDSHYLNNALIGVNGGIAWNYSGGNVRVIPQTQARFIDGVLIIQSTDEAINKVSVPHDYRLL